MYVFLKPIVTSNEFHFLWLETYLLLWGLPSFLVAIKQSFGYSILFLQLSYNDENHNILELYRNLLYILSLPCPQHTYTPFKKGQAAYGSGTRTWIPGVPVQCPLGTEGRQTPLCCMWWLAQFYLSHNKIEQLGHNLTLFLSLPQGCLQSPKKSKAKYSFAT